MSSQPNPITLKYAALTVFILVFNGCVTLNANAAKTLLPIRTEIKVTASQRAKMKDLSQVLQMATITPIVNRDDEVICMELSEIKDKMISDVLKAKVGDCFSEVNIFKKIGAKHQTYSVLSISDAMMLFQALDGAARVDVDLNRKVGKVKEIVALTYLTQ